MVLNEERASSTVSPLFFNRSRRSRKFDRSILHLLSGVATIPMPKWDPLAAETPRLYLEIVLKLRSCLKCHAEKPFDFPQDKLRDEASGEGLSPNTPDASLLSA